MARTQVSAPRLAALVGSLPDEHPADRAHADRVRVLIVDGRVLVGSRLPSERDLMAALGVSRTTVTRAYAVLGESGYAVARQGSGTVAALPSGSIRRGTGVALFPAEAGDDVLDLTCAATRAPSGVAEAYAAAVADLPTYLAGAGYLTLGVPELRQAIAARYTARGLPTRADEILVTSGAVAGMAIVTRALLGPGDRVLIENPTYPNTAEMLRRNGSRLVPVPVASTGWDTDAVRAAISASAPRAAVLIPDFHNPTGAYMPDTQRAEVSVALRRAGTLALVDETIAEVRLDDLDLAPPFAAHLPEAVLIGSASKSHWGGLRLGWIRAGGGDVMARLIEARVTIDLGAPVVEQLALLHLLRAAPGMPEERRLELRTARDAAVAGLRRSLPGVEFEVPTGGLCLWLRLPTPTAARVVEAAEQRGLLLASGNRFATTGRLDHWLRLPYVLPPDELEDAVERLTASVEATANGASTDAGPARRRTAGQGREQPGSTAREGERTAYPRRGDGRPATRPLVA